MGAEDDFQWQTVRGRNKKGRDNKQFKHDIATARRSNRENNTILTSYFFTNFPESFGAKAMFNAFQYYGDIIEVIIPAKRDREGRRFGFARFDRITDTRHFEHELDNIIIGRDKISVNLSRYHRHEGARRNIGINADRREGGEDHRRFEDSKDKENRGRSKSRFANNSHPSRVEDDRSYAHAVRNGSKSRQEGGQQRFVLSYEAAKEDLARLKKADIGEVTHPGMSYNIQNAFHRQGYFGVKVTPLGSNLTLLEGQEDGEVQALMEEASGWLDQWFKEIRPWSPKEIDVERTIWLRIYGIPSHAWNDLFFAQVVKPWGIFINADDGTVKKNTMDVARLMIRTSCQIVVDEFIDVKVNGEIFHLRVLEDSYGPMKILIPQQNDIEERESEGESEEKEEEEEEEEEVRGLMVVDEEVERELEDRLKDREKGLEDSNNLESNLNVPKFGGLGASEGGVDKVDSKMMKVGLLLGQEEGS
ncbi:hypothetical protein A2U01_0003452, partial [Trifolium medium]|nr:hypothetical protein [Trifolium medium]